MQHLRLGIVFTKDSGFDIAQIRSFIADVQKQNISTVTMFVISYIHSLPSDSSQKFRNQDIQ